MGTGLGYEAIRHFTKQTVREGVCDSVREGKIRSWTVRCMWALGSQNGGDFDWGKYPFLIIQSHD